MERVMKKLNVIGGLISNNDGNIKPMFLRALRATEISCAMSIVTLPYIESSKFLTVTSINLVTTNLHSETTKTKDDQPLKTLEKFPRKLLIDYDGL